MLLAGLSLGLLALPVYWGHPTCRHTFSSLYTVWREVREEGERTEGRTEDTQWRRELQLLLHQLMTSRLLSSRYCLYHSVSLMADLCSLAILVLYCLHFSFIDVDSLLQIQALGNSTIGHSDTNHFTNITCDNGNFICDMTNSNIFFWFSVISTLLFLLKSLMNIRGLGDFIMLKV